MSAYMPPLRWLAAALIRAGLPLTPADAQGAPDAERQAVLATVDSLLTAMSRRDVAASRNLLIPGAVLQSILDVETPGLPRTQSDTAYLHALSADTSALRERIWAPTTQVAGTMAVVWASYDFHVSGHFSHCGVDSFTLFKTVSGWQIASVAYTIRQSGCALSPLGPLTP